jgi:hypothetical protein
MDYTLEDLIIAYRKVKNDIFHDKSNISILKIVDFEENLIQNLSILLDNLNHLNFDYFSSIEFLGKFNICLKSIEIESQKDQNAVYFSNQFEETLVKKIKKVDYRFIGDVSIEFQVLGSLWIDKIGIHLEKNNSENSYGCRLDRPFQKRDEFINSETNHKNNEYKKLDCHFRPYFLDYKRWQDNSLKSIENSLADNKKIVVLTTDIKGFYHSINPNFLDNYSFSLEYNGLVHESNWELNELFCTCLSHWSNLNLSELKKTGLVDKDINHSGIPIGLSASKVIANLFLEKFDKEIEVNLNPLYYGRYVDDIIIVIEDKMGLSNNDDIWNFIKTRLGNFTIQKKDENKNNLASRHITFYNPDEVTITLNSKKEKLFILEGNSGKTFINSIRESMNENSSEWRLLPDTEDDIDNLNKDVTTCTNDIQESVNSLRKADGMSVKRLKFALHLRNFENFTEVAPENEWKIGFEKFIAICTDFIITPENFAIYIKYIPRIFGLTVALGRKDLFDKLNASYSKTWDIIGNSQVENEYSKLRSAQVFSNEKIKEVILSNLNDGNRKHNFTSNYFFNSERSRSSLKKIELYPNKLFLCDLHNKPFKNSLFDQTSLGFENLKKNSEFYVIHELAHYANIIDIKSYIDFFNKIGYTRMHHNDEYYKFPNAIFFSTRKLNTLELSIVYPNWSLSESNYSENFLKYLQLFNIPKLKIKFPEVEINNDYSDSKFVKLSFASKKSNENPKIVLTNFLTNDSSWTSIVRGDDYEPDNTRYTRIYRIINDILKESSRSKVNIDYIVLPELSMPRKCIIDIAKKLKSKGISLITGIEYETSNNLDGNYRGTVSNQLLYILNAENENYMEQVAIVQEKTIPAIHEESELFNVGGMRLQPKNNTKYIIDHKNFFFSGLICNDLLNIDYRQILRGNIDALFVVEWNKDIDMYDHIVSATSNDLHCFVAQVNNRKYGDTRLRGPLKESFERDVARVRGGDLDYFVLTTVIAKELREFQRNYRSPKKPFKPVPTGFKISEERRKRDLK